MKYIRTKDSIKIAIKKDEHHFIGNNGNIIPDWCIKQADTIEELCDGFIVELPMRHYHFYFEKERNNIAFKTAVDEYNKWRGTRSDMSIEGKGSKELVYLWSVIWVKGANGQPIPKVVAKLNEEGKLKLL